MLPLVKEKQVGRQPQVKSQVVSVERLCLVNFPCRVGVQSATLLDWKVNVEKGGFGKEIKVTSERVANGGELRLTTVPSLTR